MPDEREPTTDQRDSRSQLSDAITVLKHAQRVRDESIAERKLWLGEISKAQAPTEERRRETAERWRETDERFRQLREEEVERGRCRMP